MAIKQAAALSASLEDYLEAIFDIGGENKAVHGKDIAALLGVAKPSVTGALRLLARRGLVNYRPYDLVTLTDAGAVEAARVARKHRIIKSFFVDVLGVEDKLAHEAACRAEHGLGPTVISRLLDFMDFLKKQDDSGVQLTSRFRRFRAARQAGRKALQKCARR